MRSARDGALALGHALSAEGGTVAGVLAPLVCRAGELADPGPAQVAAAGPRARGSELEYELLLEMILEGARLHYGTPRIVRPDDPDLALLLGDHLYALGLVRLAALGDLAAVAELADVISLIAQAHAAADTELANAIWDAGAIALGWGTGAGYEAAKELARAHHPGAQSALEAVAETVLTGRPSGTL